MDIYMQQLISSLIETSLGGWALFAYLIIVGLMAVKRAPIELYWFVSIPVFVMGMIFYMYSSFYSGLLYLRCMLMGIITVGSFIGAMIFCGYGITRNNATRFLRFDRALYFPLFFVEGFLIINAMIVFVLYVWRIVVS